ncbi:MAG: 30S ribosomal protein S3 [Mycoplasmataceae bacterium]|nr:30S ribosomal protein S3 [Mycoplasmataceae bacterium]
MGQKVNPNGFRYGITKKHNATWYAEKANFAKFLLEDDIMRKYVEKFTREYSIGQIEILRNQKEEVTIKVHTAKAGVVLGKGGENLIKFTNDIQKETRNKNLKMNVQVVEIRKPELNARLIAEDIAMKLENRGSFRAAQKWVIRAALRSGAKGIKTQVSGRLNGADMARAEGYTEGEMKLHTLRQDIDFAKATARTTYGAIGIKVWVSKGEILDGGKK